MGAISAIFLLQISPFSKQLPYIFNNPRSPPSLLNRTPIRNPKSPKQKKQFFVSAEGNQLNGNERERRDAGDGQGEEELKKERRRPAFNLRWRDLLDPDPENIVAIGFTGLLTWASVQVLWQLFFISIAILLAALKYSFIAALLLFILITLL